MSKDINSGRDTGQLKKDLVQATKILRSLTHEVERLEIGLVDSDTARAKENQAAATIGKLQAELAALRAKHEQGKVSYTNVNITLNEEFQSRLQQKDRECELRLQEIKESGRSEKRELEKLLDSEKALCRSLKDNGTANQRRFDAKLKEASVSWEDSQKQVLRRKEEVETQAKCLEERNQALAQELSEHQTMLKGHETELLRHKTTIAGLEAFSTESRDTLQQTAKTLQLKISAFTYFCVESADLLPGLQPLPKELRYNGLPRFFSTQSVAGRFILAAAMEHSLYNIMGRIVFTPYGMYACQDINDLTASLQKSQEAIWRLMTVKALLQNDKLTKSSRHRFQTAADILLQEWDIFQDDKKRDGFRKKLTDLLFDAYRTWLTMLCFRNKIYTSYEWTAQTFGIDTADDTLKVPGEFGQSQSMEPVLRLSPAFLEETSSGQPNRLEVLRSGTALLRASSALQNAMNEEEQVRSPKLGNKLPRQSQQKEEASSKILAESR